MTAEGVSGRDERTLHVFCVGEGAAPGRLAMSLADARDELAVGTSTVEDLPERVAEVPVDCSLVVDPADGAVVEAVREQTTAPVVVYATTARAARLGFDAGATDVHRVVDDDELDLLVRRIERLVARGVGGADDSPDGTAGRDGDGRDDGDDRGDGEDAAADPVSAVFDGVEDGFLTVDGDWECAYANAAAEGLLGVEDLSGRRIPDALTDVSTRPVRNGAERALSEDRQVTVEVSADDRWLELRFFPGPVENGQGSTPADPDGGSPGGFAAQVRDVTDRKLRDRRLGRLLMTTKALMNAGTRSEVADVAVGAVEEVMGFRRAGVHLYDEELDRLVPTAALGSVSGTLVSETVARRAFDGGGPLVCDDLLDDPDSEAGSALVLPLNDHGVLVVAADRTGAFDQADLSVAEILATNAAAALERAERREALERYETVLETVQGMVYALDPDGRFTLVTEPLARRLGYERSELEGQHVSAILDDDAVETGEQLVRELLAGDRDSAAYETELRPAGDREGTDPDGEGDDPREEHVPVEIEMSLIPAEDGGFRGTVGAVRDRTELRETRAQLETERDRFTYLFENLPDSVAELEYVDGEPIVCNVNRAFVETFGYEPDRIIGESVNDHLIPPTESEREARELDDRLAAGESVTQELRRETADGIGDFLVRGVPYRTEGETTRAFAIYTDITEQKRRQRRLGVLNRVLRHNVRNEMTVVRGYARMIADRLVGEGIDRDLAEAAVELVESAVAIEELSTEARRVEEVLRDDHEGTTDVVDVVESVLDDQSEAHPEADLRTDLPEELVVEATDRIELTLEQVVENAIEHNDTGGDPTVLVSVAADDDGRATIRVDDDGPGIPDHERDVVTGDREVTQLEHGSGMGLWVVKWTVEGFGGRVRFVESDLGGAAVEIRLPRPDSEVGTGGRDGTGEATGAAEESGDVGVDPAPDGDGSDEGRTGEGET